MASVYPSPVGMCPAMHESKECLELGLPRLVSSSYHYLPVPQMLYPAEPPVHICPETQSPTSTSERSESTSVTHVHVPPNYNMSKLESQCNDLGTSDHGEMKTSHSEPVQRIQDNTDDQLHMSNGHDIPLYVSTPDIRRANSQHTCVTFSSDHISEQLNTSCCMESTSTNSPSSSGEIKRHRSCSNSHNYRLFSKSQARLNHGRSKSLTGANSAIDGTTQQSEPHCRRKIMCNFEKELTFQPKINDYSLKIASRNARNSVPVVHRLLEARKSLTDRYNERLTFVPKLNATSLKLAQERAARITEVQTKMAQQANARKAEALSEYTFKPRVSVRSLHIVQGLGTSFHTRQQMCLEKRQKALDDAYKTVTGQRFQSKQIINLNLRIPPVPQSNHSSTKELSSGCTPTSDTPSAGSDSSQTVLETSTQDSISRPSRLPLRVPSNATNRKSSMDGPLADSNTTRTSPQRCCSARNTPNASSPTHSLKKTRVIVVRKSRQSENKGGSLQSQSGVIKQLLDEPKFSKLSEGDRVKRVKINTERIIKAKMVFLIRDGAYRSIRNGLRRRGWVEQDYANRRGNPFSGPKRTPVKTERGCVTQVGVVSDDSDYDDENDPFQDEEEVHSDEEEYRMISRAVRNNIPNFVWTLKRSNELCRSLYRDSLVNHFAKASSFTTKVGLCSNLHNLVWYGDTDADTFFPRCYILSCDEEKVAFIDDYRFTSALCILKLVSTQYTTNEDEEPLLISTTAPQTPVSPRSPSRPSTSPGTRPTSRSDPVATVLCEQALELAMKAGRAFLSSKQHEDIEGSHTQLCPRLSDGEWAALIKYFYKLVFEQAVVKISSCYSISKANDLLDEIEGHSPQIYMEGSRNIWIVKPGAMSRGRGIMCMNNLEDILDLVASAVKKESKWVVQKYIERPLLVYDTKFDVRQWFLVTDWNPLTMWIYKDCYLRFCTQKYTLDDLDESIHLCNNSIQCHYENSSTRAKALPLDNMWDSATFKEYLESTGEGSVWDSVIYPGMKQALVNVLQVTQDEIEQRKCSFELYGADFMISSDFRPWLIEVNSSPAMGHSTAVTSRLCKAVLEDTLKVVVDRREDKDCDTGGFELAYKQTKLDCPNYVGIQLCVQGSAIQKPRRLIPSFVRKSTSINSISPYSENTPDKETRPLQSVDDQQKDSDLVGGFNRKSPPNDLTLRQTSRAGPLSDSSPQTPTPKITTCTYTLDCETSLRTRVPTRSAARRINHRTSPVKHTVANTSPTHEQGLLISNCKQKEDAPGNSNAEKMAVSASTGNVNTAMRFSRKTLPNR